MSSINLENLENYTIAEIKKWAKINGMRYPDKLKKDDAIKYLRVNRVEMLTVLFYSSITIFLIYLIWCILHKMIVYQIY